MPVNNSTKWVFQFWIPPGLFMPILVALPFLVSVFSSMNRLDSSRACPTATRHQRTTYNDYPTATVGRAGGLCGD